MLKISLSKISLSAILAIAFIGCGSGSSDSASQNPTSSSSSAATSSSSALLPEQMGTQNNIFYGETNYKKLGSLKNVKVASAAAPQSPVVASGILDVRHPVINTTLTYSGNLGYTDLHQTTLSYVSEGAPFKVSLLKSDTPAQIANSSAIGLSAPVHTKISYLGSHQYLTATDVNGSKVLITSDMGASDAPLPFVNKTLLSLSCATYGGAINGYVVYDSVALKVQKCDLAMQNCADLLDAATAPKYYGDIHGTTAGVIYNGQSFYKLDKASNAATELAVSKNNPFSTSLYSLNGDSLYYVSDGNIYRFNINTQATTQLSSDLKASGLKSVGYFTDDMVVYGGDAEMHAVKKDGTSKGAEIEISVTTTLKGQKYPFSMAVGKQYLYNLYTVDANTGKTTFRACKLENGVKECKDDSFWGGITAAKTGTLNYTSTYPYTPYAYIRIDDTDNYGGGKIKAISPSDPFGDGIVLGEIATYNFQTFMHNYYYADEMIDSEGNVVIYAKNDLDFTGNAFLVNLTKENSLINLTNETAPATGEINGGDLHCHGRYCSVCHSFAGGKIYEDKAGIKEATGYNIKLLFEDGSSVLANKGKGKGENFNIPLANLVGKNFKAVVVDANGTEKVKSVGYYHQGAKFFNCDYCHGRGGDLREEAPNVITIEN